MQLAGRLRVVIADKDNALLSFTERRVSRFDLFHEKYESRWTPLPRDPNWVVANVEQGIAIAGLRHMGTMLPIRGAPAAAFIWNFRNGTVILDVISSKTQSNGKFFEDVAACDLCTARNLAAFADQDGATYIIDYVGRREVARTGRYGCSALRFLPNGRQMLTLIADRERQEMLGIYTIP